MADKKICFPHWLNQFLYHHLFVWVYLPAHASKHGNMIVLSVNVCIYMCNVIGSEYFCLQVNPHSGDSDSECLDRDI